MSHLFISYSKRDLDFARYLRQLLVEQGFMVWMDETRLVPSEEWWPTIEKNIVSCAAFVVIMTADSQKSKWVERELLVAEEEKKPIFPVLLSGKGWRRLGEIQHEDMQAGMHAKLRREFVEGLARFAPRWTGQEPPPSLPALPQVIAPTKMKRHSSLLMLIVTFLIVAAATALIVWVAPRLIPPAANIGVTNEVLQPYVFETIVDANGEFEGKLPDTVSGVVAGATMFRQEPNRAWYPVVVNPADNEDNIVEIIAISSDGLSFNGYFKHNSPTWAAMSEHVGKPLRILLFLQ
ncbi:MAG: toll/interleukin-1 receptor domain-containing protein [Anaerolineae bacterium]